MQHAVFGVGTSVVLAIWTIYFLVANGNAVDLGNLIRRLPLGEWYMPSVWLPGLVVGFLVNRKKRALLPCLTFLPWLAWMLYNLSIASKDQFFPSRSAQCDTSECLGVLLVTYPFANSVTYSIGALSCRLFGKNGQNTDCRDARDDNEPITLGLS
jgi:hypothetical protein